MMKQKRNGDRIPAWTSALHVRHMSGLLRRLRIVVKLAGKEGGVGMECFFY